MAPMPRHTFVLPMPSPASLVALLLLFLATACTSQPHMSRMSLQYLGNYEISFNKQFKGTTIGGLSGIDYDPKNDRYFLISDDRSAINHARFYTAKIYLNQKGIDSVQFTGVYTLKQSNGLRFPNTKENPAKTPDPEAIRFNAATEQLMWTNEGERNLKGKTAVLTDPAITIMDLAGNYVAEFPLPPNLLMQQGDNGPRQNGTLEGLTFSNGAKQMFVSLEEPLYEDGPRADIHENNAWIRIFRYEVATRKNVAQYAYKLDPVAYPPVPEKSFMVNGIPDILAIDSAKLLLMERSFSTGRLQCTVKVFLTDLSHADNILSVTSLLNNPPAHPATKELILNMDDLGIYIDNVEGVTFGPTLPNGHRTLVFVADNNFNAFEKSQLLLFEVIE